MVSRIPASKSLGELVLTRTHRPTQKLPSNENLQGHVLPICTSSRGTIKLENYTFTKKKKKLMQFTRVCYCLKNPFSSSHVKHQRIQGTQHMSSNYIFLYNSSVFVSFISLNTTVNHYWSLQPEPLTRLNQIPAFGKRELNKKKMALQHTYKI